MLRFQFTRQSYLREVSLPCLTLSLAAISFAGVAHAQDAKGSGDDNRNEIVVTGTLLRKVAPAGAETLTLGSEEVKASGATSTTQLLANIPQLQGFGTTPAPGAGGNQLTVNRTNLRNLPQSVGASSPTLVLMDGHRLVGEGVKQSYADPAVIPPGLIDRVEVVYDGGSAIYGADAMGGVINFITKHDFDGIQVDGTHGFGEQYNTTNLNFLSGKRWDSGSAYVAYSYAYNSSIANADRAFEKQLSYASGTGMPAGLQCSPGNVQAGGATYAITSPTTFAPGNQNLCDTTKQQDFFPKEVRHTVMAGFHQDLSPSLEFEVKAYYSTRTTTSNNGPRGFTVTESSGVTFPYPAPYNNIPVFGTPTPTYQPVTPGGTAAESVSGNFVTTTGAYDPQIVKLWAWGITPSLTWRIGHDWQMHAFYNAGQSSTTVNDPGVNSVDLQAATNAGTFNPYNPGAASNAAAIADALNYELYGIGRSHMDNARVVFDGPVLHLPGGDVRAAVGGEYLREEYVGTTAVNDTYQRAINTNINPLSYYARHDWSGFAEINLPLIGPDNALPFIKSFTIHAAERYDSYSDFGKNWSPSLDVSLRPVDWINLRGHWTKTFQAPSPANLAFANSAASFFPSFFYGFDPLLINNTGNLGTLAGGGNPGATTTNGFIAVQGNDPHLKPQRATDWDLGIDVTVPGTGLTLRTTYFHIDYKGTIGTPTFGFGALAFSQYQNSYAMNPTYAQVLQVFQSLGVSASSAAQALANVPGGCTANSCPLYVIENVLATNLGGTKTSGLDIGADFRHATGFGGIYANFNGTYLLNYQNSPSAGAAYTPNGVGNQLSGSGVGRFSFVGTLGATVGSDFRGQVKWNHVPGYALATPAGNNQTSIGSFNTFDFYFQYDLKQLGHLPPISLSLAITNAFNTNPPVYYGSNALVGNGYAGSTLGRVVQVGASVKF